MFLHENKTHVMSSMFNPSKMSKEKLSNYSVHVTYNLKRPCNIQRT